MSASYRVIIAARASEELTEIFDYIALDSPQNARAMVERIRTSLESLKIFPHRTVVEDPPSQHPVRSLPVPPYMVFFRVDDDQRLVSVVRIIHGARQRPKRFE